MTPAATPPVAAGWLARHVDVALAVAVVAIFALMIVPLPPVVLDLLIAANLAVAAVLLALSLQVSDALQISAFPSLLLLTTLFRLGLEISATRLVLLHAHAGEVIQAFGTFVVGGSLVVGLVVFSILTLVQYLVISKGAERVAEVAARFTLDAMPGKQMAIDADLRAGFIDVAEARRRRSTIGRESQLFGSMDGAMKFVKGDAIAGLVILAINLVGGLAIGVLEHDMTLADAARVYAILSIGGGLVAQIPALVISTAAGIVVTRVASEAEGDGHSDQLGQELARQLGQHPRAIGVASGLLVVLAIIPGLPALPFLLLGAATGLLAWRRSRRGRATGDRAAPGFDGSSRDGSPRSTASPIYVVPGAIRIALAMVGSETTGAGPPSRRGRRRRAGRIARLWTRRLREGLWEQLGLATPDLGIEVVEPVAARARCDYQICLGGELRVTGRWSARGSDQEPAVQSMVRVDALVHLAPPAHVAQLCGELRALARELIEVEATERWVSAWQRTQPALVREVFPRTLSILRLTEVLRGLCAEGVSLRDGVPIFEALAGLSPGAQPAPDVMAMVERVRGRLGRRLVAPHLDGEGRLRAVELETVIEDAIRDGVRDLGEGRTLAVEPQLSKDMIAAITRAFASAPSTGMTPVILTHKDLRPHVHTLIEGALPQVAVIAYGELPPETAVQYVARARIAA